MLLKHSAQFGSLATTSLNLAMASSNLPSLASVAPASNALLIAAFSAAAFLASAADMFAPPPPPLPGVRVKFSSLSSRLTRVSCVWVRVSLVTVTL